MVSHSLTWAIVLLGVVPLACDESADSGEPARTPPAADGGGGGGPGGSVPDGSEGQAPDHGADPADDKAPVSVVLEGVANDVVGPAVVRFQAKAAVMASAQAGDPLKEAWLEAATAWQELAVAQFGPAGPEGLVVGGRDLAEEIDSWPLTNECRIDQETAAVGYEAADFFESEHVNVYGLDAMDYLLFAPTTGSTCNAMLPLVKDGTWAAIAPEEILRRRQAYAGRLAKEVARQADVLAQAWAEDAGDWGRALGSAGAAESPYADTATAVNDVFAALFYVDTVVKDLKVAKPAGLLDCSADVCPHALEAPWSGRGRDFVLANLTMAELLVGAFGPMLRERSAQSLGAELLSEVAAAKVAVQGLSADLKTALAEDPETVRQAHTAIKRFTDLLKGPFVTSLSLTIPDDGAGDND